MKFSTCVAGLVFALSAGCTGNPVSTDTWFLEKQTLTGKVLLPSEALLDPENLVVTDSLLLVCNRNDAFYLQAFRLPGGDELGRFLSKGNGPEDFIYLGGMQRSSDNRSVYVSDFATHKLFRYDVEGILHNRFVPFPVDLPDRKREVEGTQFTYYWVTRYGIVAQNITDKGRLCLFTPDTFLFGGEYPAPERLDERLREYPFASTRLYQSQVALSPFGDKMVLACDLGDMLDVCSLHDRAIETRWSYWQSYPDEVVVMPSGEGQYMAGSTLRSTYHYLGVCASDHFIFALYSGKKLGQPDYMTGSRIRVVDWDGTKSQELQTPDKLRAISLSPDGNTLYGIHQTDEGFEIKIYDLTNLF